MRSRVLVPGRSESICHAGSDCVEESVTELGHRGPSGCKQTIGRINKGLFPYRPTSGQGIGCEALIQLLFTSVLFCEVTKTLRVPAPSVEMLNEVLPRMFGKGFIGLPVAVIWFALNTPPSRCGTRDARERCGSEWRRRHRIGAGRGTAPGAAPIVTVAELAVEAQRNAPAIPTRARCFAFMFMVPCVLARRQSDANGNK